MVSYMDDDLEARRQRLADLLDHSAELTQRTNELLAQPRPEMTYEPPQSTRYRGYHEENKARDALEEKVIKRLDAVEAKFSKRMDVIEARQLDLSNRIQNGLEVLADVTGSESGLLERRLREEYRKEIETLRSEIALLRSQANAPARRQKATSRAPWKDIGDALRN